MSSSRRLAGLNCGLAAPPTTTTCHTPNTPEILNAIVNISFPTPPLAPVAPPPPPGLPQTQAPSTYQPQAPEAGAHYLGGSASPQALAQSLVGGPPPLSSPCYSDCSSSSGPGTGSGMSPLASPTGLHSSVQHIHSQFIKEGLKMKVKQKLKSEPEDSSGTAPSIEIKKELEDLTPEDEERRRRRRERNKVAATKCRNKKKEKTHILVAESEIVEVQNASLKAEVARLDAEKRRLTSILAQHEPNCAKRRRVCGGEEGSRQGEEQHHDTYDLPHTSHTFRRPAAPTQGFCGIADPSQQGGGYTGYSTNRQHPSIQGIHKEEEEQLEATTTTHLDTEAFKEESKDFKYSSDTGGGVYELYKYELMTKQAAPSLPDYSVGPSRGLGSYTGGYYDHMCLAL